MWGDEGVSSHQIVHIKLTKCYMTIISHKAGEYKYE